jgi:hypothetical protein
MKKFFTKAHSKYVALCSVLALALMALVPGAALATESPTAEKVKEVATKVSSEGVEIILIVLTALVTLIVAVIIIPKAIGFIRRFV